MSRSPDQEIQRALEARAQAIAERQRQAEARLAEMRAAIDRLRQERESTLAAFNALTRPAPPAPPAPPVPASPQVPLLQAEAPAADVDVSAPEREASAIDVRANDDEAVAPGQLSDDAAPHEPATDGLAADVMHERAASETELGLREEPAISLAIPLPVDIAPTEDPAEGLETVSDESRPLPVAEAPAPPPGDDLTPEPAAGTLNEGDLEAELEVGVGVEADAVDLSDATVSDLPPVHEVDRAFGTVADLPPVDLVEVAPASSAAPISDESAADPELPPVALPDLSAEDDASTDLDAALDLFPAEGEPAPASSPDGDLFVVTVADSAQDLSAPEPTAPAVAQGRAGWALRAAVMLLVAGGVFGGGYWIATRPANDVGPPSAATPDVQRAVNAPEARTAAAAPEVLQATPAAAPGVPAGPRASAAAEPTGRAGQTAARPSPAGPGSPAPGTVAGNTGPGTTASSTGAPSPSARPAAERLSAPATSLKVELDASRNVWMRLLVDGETITNRIFKAGEHIALDAKRTVEVRTGDAGAVRVKVNGNDRGPIGRPGQVLTHRIDR